MRTAEAAPTLAAATSEAAGRLERAGVGTAKIDAQRLAAHALGVSWSGLWSRMREPLTERAYRTLEDLVARRVSREPLAYILGSQPFMDLELEVGPGVLVPRSETETLAEVALELIESRRAPLVIDVGTGSGAIAAAIATARPDARVVASEVDANALEFARRNADRLGADVRLVMCDGLDAFAAGADLVVSNPPYVPDGYPVMPEVLREPARAVFAGPRGDEVLMELVVQAGRVVGSRGSLAVEVGTPRQADDVLAACRWASRRGIREDRAGAPRVAWATRE
jgi:release factor glutamine methyltransferase